MMDLPVVLFTNSQAMGGMEQHVLLLASGLVARGIRTAVVCPQLPEIAPLRDELTGAGVAVHTPADRGGALGPVRRVRELAAVFRPYRGGILHVHSTGFHGGDLVLLAGKRAGMGGMVRTEHVPPQPPVGLRDRVQVRVRDRLFLAKVICVSSSNRDEHIDVLGRDGNKLTVIPNGIDIDRFRCVDGRGVRRELGLADDVQLVGVVSRLAEARKGIAEFVGMAASVARDHQNVHFVVVGDGPLRPSLERLAADTGTTERISFLGSRDDVARVVAAMNVFVLPSLWEAGPLTLLEAMALGTAVVTTPVGVAPDVVQHEHNGLVVPIGDVEAMADAVDRLLRDADLVALIGAKARSDARRSFGIEHMVDQTVALYESVVAAS